MKVGGHSGRRSFVLVQYGGNIVVEGGVQNLMKTIDEFQTDNKVQFVRETITKDFGSAGMVLFQLCITFTV